MSQRFTPFVLICMSLSPDGVANAVLSVYRCFPKNGKPSTRKGEPEWTVLAGIVLSSLSDDQSRAYECVALGTGLRALPYAKLPPQGDLLHDAHAEVLTRRSFKLWLIRMLRRSKETGELDSRFQVRDAYVHVRKDVKIVLYVSTLPCTLFAHLRLSLVLMTLDKVETLRWAV